MSPGVWHHACCCTGSGLWGAYVFAAQNGDYKPVMLTVADGAITTELITPDGYAAGNNAVYPASYDSSLAEIAFVYEAAGRALKLGVQSAWGGWGYEDIKVGGVAVTETGNLGRYEYLEHDGDDAMRLYLETSENHLTRTGVGAWTSTAGATGVAWTIQAGTETSWTAYSHSLGDGTWDVCMREVGGAVEVIANYPADGYYIVEDMCSLSDGRLVASGVLADVGGSLYGVRLFERSVGGAFTTHDLILPGVEDAVMIGHMHVDDEDTIHVVMRAWTDPNSTYIYAAVDGSDFSHACDSILTEAGARTTAVLTDTARVPQVVLGPTANGGQLKFCFGGSSWTTEDTAYAGGFKWDYLKVAWDAP